MTSLQDIIDVNGQKAFAEAMGCTIANVTHMKTGGRIPARLYRRVKAYCETNGLDEPPEALFSFEGPLEVSK